MDRLAAYLEIQIPLYKEDLNGIDPSWKRPKAKKLRAMVEEVMRERGE